MQIKQKAKYPFRKRKSRVIRTMRISLAIIATSVLIFTIILFILTFLQTGSFSPILLVLLSVVVPSILGLIQVIPIIFPKPSSSEMVTSLSHPHFTHIHEVDQHQGHPVQLVPRIFYPNLPLQNIHEYYGRHIARNELISRVMNGGSSSIIGDRRVGKTWILNYLQLYISTNFSLRSTYRVGYVSATHPQCKTLASFVQHTLHILNVPSSSIDPSLAPFDQFARSIQLLKSQGMISVLCIDEFEGFNNVQEFGSYFIEGLRAMAQDDGLVLVIASKRPLSDVILHMTGQTSPLFNIVRQIKLLPFVQEEAQQFIRDKGKQANFDVREQAYFQQCASISAVDGVHFWPPLRLQLVGEILLEDKQTKTGQFDTDDPRYQTKFEQRLEEEYQVIMRQHNG